MAVPVSVKSITTVCEFLDGGPAIAKFRGRRGLCSRLLVGRLRLAGAALAAAAAAPRLLPAAGARVGPAASARVGPASGAALSGARILATAAARRRVSQRVGGPAALLRVAAALLRVARPLLRVTRPLLRAVHPAGVV